MIKIENRLNKANNLLKLKFLFLFLLTVIVISPSLAQSVDDLWIHVRNDRAAQVQQLLDRGLDPNTRDGRGNPILMQAVRDNAWSVFDVVLVHPDTDIKIINGYQETPLMYVSLVGDLERARRLVQMGALVNHLGWTPLHYAASTGKIELVQYLLAQGAMPNAPAPDGSSPIMMAAQAGANDTVQVLLAAGADPEAVNTNGLNAVRAARARGHNRLADALDEVIAQRRAQQR